MNSKKSIIEVEIDFDVLKDYHPLLGAHHSSLSERNYDLQKYQDKISYPHLSCKDFNGLIYGLEVLFKTKHKLENWKRHRDHFLYLTDTIMLNDVINYEHIKHHQRELDRILGYIIELKELKTKRSPKTLLICFHFIPFLLAFNGSVRKIGGKII